MCPNAKSCQNEYIKVIDVLAQRSTIMCLIMLTVNCQAICETCPQCNVVPLPHLTNTVVLCRLQLITLTTVSFSRVLCQQSSSDPECLSMYATSCCNSLFGFQFLDLAISNVSLHFLCLTCTTVAVTSNSDFLSWIKYFFNFYIITISIAFQNLS